MEEKMVTSFDGVKLYLKKETTAQDQAVCVIVHGLCEHSGRYDYLADCFHKAHIGTYRFDHRGHGRSEGERTYYADYQQMMKDIDQFVNVAIEENPQLPVFLLGHSMGGFGVALYGAMYPHKKLRGIITSGALTYDNGRLIKDVPAGQDPHATLPNQLGAGVCSVAEVVDWYGKDPYNTKTFTFGLCYAIQNGIEWYGQHVQDFNYPVLMMHGEKDGLVSVQDTYQQFKAVSSKDRQMKIYGGLFHEIFNEYCRDETIGDAVNWISNRI
jgi:lysophospholipase